MTKLVISVTLLTMFVQPYRMRHHGRFPVLLPNAEITPGDYDDVPLKELCSKGYAARRRAQQYRELHPSWDTLRRAVFAAYGVIDHRGVCQAGCEGDHLVSEELGGRTTRQNIWPQPYGGFGAHDKDRLENQAHRAVCDGRITLRYAQRKMAQDWLSFYAEMNPQEKK